MAVNTAILVALVVAVLRVADGGGGPAHPVTQTAVQRQATTSRPATPGAVAAGPPAALPTKAQILALRGRYFGISAPDFPWSSETFSAVTDAASLAPDLAEYFVNFSQKFSTVAAASAYKHGALPMISLEPWNGSTAADTKVDARKPDFALATITAGKYDAYLTEYATAVRQFGAPVAIRFAHEMNGTWYPWCEKVNGNKPGDYVKAWRHVHDLFAKAGAQNVIWVWSPNNLEGASGSIAGLYPGDAYVDWVGMSAYLTVGNNADTVLDPGLKAIRKLTAKPLVITETGAEPGPTKATRTASLFTWLATHPDVIGFVWFEKTKANGAGTDWRFDTDPVTKSAFQAGLRTLEMVRPPTIPDLG